MFIAAGWCLPILYKFGGEYFYYFYIAAPILFLTFRARSINFILFFVPICFELFFDTFYDKGRILALLLFLISIFMGLLYDKILRKTLLWFFKIHSLKVVAYQNSALLALSAKFGTESFLLQLCLVTTSRPVVNFKIFLETNLIFSRYESRHVKFETEFANLPNFDFKFECKRIRRSILR